MRGQNSQKHPQPRRGKRKKRKKEEKKNYVMGLKVEPKDL